MKNILFRLLICILLINSLFMGTGLSVTNVLAEEEMTDISTFEFPTPKAPNYMMFEAADRSDEFRSDALYIVNVVDADVLKLSSEYENDRDAFLEKYGLYDFRIVMQYDSSLDGTDNWNHNAEWDTYYGAPGVHRAADIAWIRNEMFDTMNLFDLYEIGDSEDEVYLDLAPALIKKEHDDGEYTWNTWYFDKENHSLSVRCRYYMEWQTYDGETIGETQSKFSDWSEVAIFGKDGTAIEPSEPSKYEAPIISDLRFVTEDGFMGSPSLYYEQTTPESVWDAGIYYLMTEDGFFEGLETQISLNDGDWQSYNTSNSGGDWCLCNGTRHAWLEEPVIKEDDHVKIRVRFVGSHGPSEWSNVIEINADEEGTKATEGSAEESTNETVQESVSESGSDDSTQGTKPDTDKKDVCTLCGFCPMPLGLCIIIWLIIIVVVIVLLFIIIFISTGKKKCKNCGAKLKKENKFCPKCGTPRR